MRFLDGPKWPLNLALGASRGAGAVLAGRGMRLPVNMQFPHHVTEYPAFGHRSVVEIQHLRASPEMGFRNGGFGSHGIKKKTQCRFGIFTVNAPILLVGDVTSIAHHLNFVHIEAMHFGWNDRRFAAAVDTARLRRRDPLQLTFTAQIGFKFGKNTQHIEEGFAGGSTRIDRSFRCLEGNALQV